LNPTIFNNIIEDKVAPRFYSFIISGCWPFLRPLCEEILASLNKRGNCYVLLSGLLSDKIISMVKEFKVRHISLSLGGSQIPMRT
jgi:hypothetical protein